ncbi:MAG: hypothetical protein AAF802_04245 [Planctomycetota bacterium]
MGFRASVLLIAMLAWTGTSPCQQPLVDPVDTEPATSNSVPSGDEPAPYIVFVAEPDSFVRCGPGGRDDGFYPTERVRIGQELEVYLEMDSGWLGVRPLKESFCWVRAQDLEFAADGKTAQVVKEGTAAMIGTGLGEAEKYRWQVELSVGEKVFVLGDYDAEASDRKTRWLRIAPPSGEFRFIHRDQVVETAEALATRVAANVQRPSRSEIAAAGHQLEDPKRVVQQTSSRRRTQVPSATAASGTLTATDDIAELKSILGESPVPPVARSSPDASGAARRSTPDKAIQFHRGADAEDFADRGAVIGSGLREDWETEADTDPQLNPVSGARAAAAAIAKPIQEMSNVVANFISPPRLVEIGPNRETEFQTTVADQRWMVGGQRETFGSSQLPPSPSPRLAPLRPLPPQSLAAFDQGNGIRQVVALEPKKRVVPIAKIARVEDAVRAADLETTSEVLSKLIAETASADEIDPVIRQLEALLQAGNVNEATRLRQLLRRAQDYRNLAARRDGPSVIQTSVASQSFNDSLRSPGLTPSNEPQLGSDAAPTPPSAKQTASAPMPIGTASPGREQTTNAEGSGAISGNLVQVYSSRPNSPPYALTDERGLTVAYVTPYPGVNLRPHLNSRVTVQGQEKLLQGISIPHILASEAARQ